MTEHPSFRLFDNHPASSLAELIVFDPDMDERTMALSYEEAATRLAASFQSTAVDDLILMPLLFLWRQTIELTLKATIRDLCALRRQQGDMLPDLLPAKVDERLRNPAKIGHNLTKLTEELATHLTAVGAPTTPPEVEETLELLAEIDNKGTGFRYAGLLSASRADVNLRTLNERLRYTSLMLAVTIDAVTNGQGV